MYKRSDRDNEPLSEILRLVREKDSEAQLRLLEKFSRTIKSFSYKLNYDGADTDLIIFLLELCQSMKPHRFENMNEGALVKYIYNSLRHEYIRLSKQNKRYKLNEQLYGIDPSEITSNNKTTDNNSYSDKYIDELIDVLTAKEKQIVTYIFIKGYSDAEIAKVMSVSRQAVGKTKKRALQKLKHEICKEIAI